MDFGASAAVRRAGRTSREALGGGGGGQTTSLPSLDTHQSAKTLQPLTVKVAESIYTADGQTFGALLTDKRE